MGQDLVLPDWARNKPALAFAELNAQEDNLSDGIGQSYPVIGYKGKVWSFRHRGERKNFIRPDDGTPASYLDVIILGQAKNKSKSLYKKYDQNQSEGERPICSSIDGLTPDPDVTSKQADVCALCPKNQWKTDPVTGKKGRECTDYKRLAVLVLPTQTKPLFGEPVLEAAFLRVPPASLNSLAIMGDTMASQGFHYAAYITRITFDPNEAHPKMVFRPLQGLGEGEAPLILQMRKDMQVDRIIHGGFADAGMRVIPPQEGTVLLPPAGSNVTTGLSTAGQNVQEVQRTAPSAINGSTAPVQQTNSTGLASAQPATHALALMGSGVATPASEANVLTGLGGATPAPIQQAGIQQVVGDTGAPEATDDDLDAKIAGMLGNKPTTH